MGFNPKHFVNFDVFAVTSVLSFIFCDIFGKELSLSSELDHDHNYFLKKNKE